MAVLHISEAEAIRDFASVLAQVRAGTEVIIESDNAAVARLVPPADVVEEPEPGYDEWFRAEVQEGLACDPATDLDEEMVEAHFAKRREESLQKLASNAA